MGLAAAMSPARVSAETPAGTRIVNVATVTHAGGGPATTQSNAVSTVVRIAPTPSALEILRFAPASGLPGSTSGPTTCALEGAMKPLGPPVGVGGAAIDPTQPASLAMTPALHGGEAAFLRLTDRDQNLDATKIDSIRVEVTTPAGDREKLRLSENGPDTGVFVGYVQTVVSTAVPGNCVLEVELNGAIDASYRDANDAGDESAASARIDSWGVVFDARSGTRINGARVRLVDARTGAPAFVLGDDGVSAYPAEIVTGETVTDAGGTAYVLPDGVYRFPLVTPGNYRVEVEPPAGYVFPTGRSAAELAQTPGGPYQIGEGSFGRDYAVADPTAAAADLPLDAVAASLFVQKAASTAAAVIGDFVKYTVTAQNTSTDVPVAAVRIEDRLPAGLRYRAGSARLGDDKLADPAISADGRTLTFDAGPLAPDAKVTIRYVVEVTVAARGREISNSAQAFAPDGSASNLARAVILLRDELFRDRAILVGRVAVGPCGTAMTALHGVENVRVYLEDGRSSTTDSEGKYHFDDVTPGSHVVQLDTLTLPGSLEAATCSGEPNHAGRGFSQFVELRGGSLWRADFRLKPSEMPVVETPVVATPAEGAGATVEATAPVSSTTPAATPAAAIDVATLAPGVGWELPREGDAPAIPSIKVAVRHLPAQQVTLEVNGTPAHILNFDGAESNEAKTVAVSRWRGIELKDGENTLVAVVRGADGAEIERLERQVHYAGGAVQAVLAREASHLVADGRTHPVIALRMTDLYGKSARPGTQGTWKVLAPHRSWWEVETMHDNKFVTVGEREPTFSVDADGIARLELEPTTQAGAAIVTLRFDERHRQEIRVWLEPEARDWILVGIAEGTAAFNSISSNMQAAKETGLEDGYTTDGRVAFFAKGVVKGEYLLTAAYDSAKDTAEAKRRLLGVVDPNRFYPLYGDATEPRDEAASAHKLFLKLERRQFSALFGDFETGLTVTELSRYSRTMSGFKAEYAGETLGYTAFAAESEQGFVKDELAGDGTSGLYRLSHKPIILNSDKVRIEVRDRFRSERVLDAKPQTRYLDYDIDTVAGTIFFKRPVPSRDEAFNPIVIVVDYEVLNGGGEELTAGGRALIRKPDDSMELGASYVTEGAAAGATDVAGLDFRWDLDTATKLRAELARSSSDDPLRPDSATAYLAELTRISGSLDARAYVREQEAGFGVGQQAGTESGTRKIGADGRWRLGDENFLEGELYRQDVLSTGATRDLVSASYRREADDYAYGAGLRHVEDAGLANGDVQSDLAFLTGRVDLWDDRIVLRASQDVALGGNAGSSDYPARTRLGVDYNWRPGSTVFTEYEHAEGDTLSSDMTRVGLRTTPWERAQFQSSVAEEATEYGPRVFANFGLTQAWQLNERWGIDAGIDQTHTIREPGFEPLNPNVPLASGSMNDDFVAVFVGTQYRSPVWTFTTRAESRSADSEDRWLLSAGFYREPESGHAFSAFAQVIDSAMTTGADTRLETVELSWAQRPVSSAWILLDRLDLKRNTQADSLSAFESARIINNLNANWQAGSSLQLGVQVGARYVASTFDDERYDGFTGLVGVDARRAFGDRIDGGLHAATLHSTQSGIMENAIGLDVGYVLTKNLWISLGYNVVGFDDSDFSASRYTAQGPYIQFRAKADQDTFKDLSTIQRGRSPN